MLRNNPLDNIFAKVIIIKTLFASAKPSAIADCRGKFRALKQKAKILKTTSATFLTFSFQLIFLIVVTGNDASSFCLMEIYGELVENRVCALVYVKQARSNRRQLKIAILFYFIFLEIFGKAPSA